MTDANQGDKSNENAETQQGASQLYDRLKGRIEELELQLSLAGSEAADFFNAKKHEFSKFLDGASAKLKDMDDLGEEKAAILRDKLIDLRDKVTATKGETQERLQSEAAQFQDSLSLISGELKQMGTDAAQGIQSLADELDARSEDFQTKLETYRVQLNLAKSDAADALADKRKELDQTIADAKSRLQAGRAKVSEEWEEFSEETLAAWGKIRSGLKDFFK